MAYFSHAFQKTFVLNEFMLAGTTEMDPGQGSFFDAKTFALVPLAQASISQHPRVVFVTGSYRGQDADSMGAHGGYSESMKSEVIDARHVHRYWRTKGRDIRQHKIALGFDGDDYDTNPAFYCGRTYHLRIDLTGSPVLRAIDRNFQQVFDVRAGCCTGGTPQLVDPMAMMMSFAKQINEGAISSKFLHAVTTDGDGPMNPDGYVASTDPDVIANTITYLELTVAYQDTDFSYFAMDPRDHYELEPVVIASAELIDDSGDPCSGFKELKRRDLVTPRAREGYGQSILREVILTNEYMQDPFPWTARKKDIVNFGSLAADVVDPLALYDSYYILHSTPRKYNPSGIYDNDQYLLRICVQQGSGEIADLEAWLTAYMGSVGVVMEDLSLTA